MIKCFTGFNFNGNDSSNYDVINCYIDSSWPSEQFIYEREIVLINVKGKDKPYFQQKKQLPLRLNVTLAFKGEVSSLNLRNLAKLFDQSYFKPLYFYEKTKGITQGATHNGIISTILLDVNARNIDDYYNDFTVKVGNETKTIIDYTGSTRTAIVDSLWDSIPINGSTYELTEGVNSIYYVMLDGSPELTSDGVRGYVNLEFVCDSSYVYTPNKFIVLPSSPYTFSNLGDIDCLPYITITMSGNSNITLSNTTNSDSFTFTGLSNGEVVTIDIDNEIIETNISGVYRYDRFSGNYLRLIPGNNILTFTGLCTIRFDYFFRKLC